MQTDSFKIDSRKRLMQLINIAKGKLLLDEDTYRSLLKGITGKDSLRAMGLHELETVLEVLKQKGFKPHKGEGRQTTARRLSKPSGHSKLALIDRIVAVWITMGHHLVITDPSEAALDAYVRRMTSKANGVGMGVDSVRWLDEVQAVKVLESLKNWHKRELLERIAQRGEALPLGKSGAPAGYQTVVNAYLGAGAAE
ncbi:regulatory protein GemA [Shewanella sp. 3B26]|uniref:Regulatory protein GemA n=1 Tax=Shewanella zhuhaiensis TaxID=2919576 RepID=A0AAJ1F0X7_9GAMM|nr:regulatory protein GemA [Shewanella zhuhaiensis]MCH4295596.1 regulatory protein GemA [Shewanella zhuhaiensis]